MLITPDSYETQYELADLLQAGNTIGALHGELWDDVREYDSTTLDYAIKNNYWEYFDNFIKYFCSRIYIGKFLINDMVKYYFIQRSDIEHVLSNISNLNIQTILELRPEVLQNKRFALVVASSDLDYVLSLLATTSFKLLDRCADDLDTCKIIEKYINFNTIRNKNGQNILHLLCEDSIGYDTIPTIIEYICNVYPELINVQDDKGNTPLHILRQDKSGDDIDEITSILIKYGAEPLIENNRGLTIFGASANNIRLWLGKN